MIFAQLSKQLTALDQLLIALTDEQYTRSIAHLGQESIGSHTRHIIGLLQCATTGYASGIVDYINRTRDLTVASSRAAARAALQTVQEGLRLPDKPMQLLTTGNDSLPAVTTSFFREIVYHAEHTIHHLALIKVALVDMQLDLVDPYFGMADSTIQYKTSS